MTGDRRVRTLFTGQVQGNLSTAVGDDPAAVAARQAATADRIGVPAGHTVWMGQVHGTAVASVDAPQPRPVPQVDGLVTTSGALALAVLVADCVPVLAADPEAGVIGAGHAGRVGAAAGLLPALIRAMARLGARPDRIEWILGPAICGRCYEVPATMRDEVAAQLPASACRTAAGTPGLDLRAGLAAEGVGLGLRPPTLDPRCTREDPALFSHRRDAPTGRQAGLIRLV